MSTSRNWAVWIPEFLDRYDPDPIRYALAANMPETSDSDFSWADFLRRNNNELVATYGNLVHRVLSMVGRNFDGKVPQPGELDDTAKELLSEAQQRFDETEQNLRECHFRAALQSAMFLAQAANRYLDAKAPWKAVKGDIEDAATTLWVGMTVINCLKTIFDPFLPFSSEKLQTMLGLEGTVQDEGWVWSQNAIKPGAALPVPQPLFTKLDDSIIEEETARLGK